MRILAVDPGSKRLGLALSDETGTIAAPLAVIVHVSRLVDAATVARIACEHEARLIVIGQSFTEAGELSASGRSAARFAEVLKSQTSLPIVFWDEAFSTRDARAARIAQGATRRKRSGHLDDLAAAVLLQSYLDVQRPAEQQP